MRNHLQLVQLIPVEPGLTVTPSSASDLRQILPELS